jgi:hypothetical protein
MIDTDTLAATNWSELRRQVREIEEQNEILKNLLIEERAAVLTCDICDGGGEYDDLSISGSAAMRGEPTRVTDYVDEEARRALAREQLTRKYPDLFQSPTINTGEAHED